MTLRPIISILFLMTTGALALGCGDDESAQPAEEYVDTYVDGLTRTGEFFSVKLMTASPAPPDKGLNTWTLAVTDSDGAAVTDATVMVSPLMPAHGHGSNPKDFHGVLEDGMYTFTDMNLYMAGRWTMDITIEQPSGTKEVLQFAFDLEG